MPTEPSNPRLQRMPLNCQVGSLLLLSKAMAYILSEDRPMNSYEEWQSCPITRKSWLYELGMHTGIVFC